MNTRSDAPRALNLTSGRVRAVTGFAALTALVVFGLGFGWLKGNHTQKDWLYAWGGATEFVGISLLAAPEFLVMIGWLLGHLRTLMSVIHRGQAALRRLFTRPVSITRSAAAAGGVAMGGRVRGIISKDRRAPIEEKVDYLLDRDEAMQNALADFREALEDETKGREEGDADLRRSVTEEQKEEREALRRENQRARVAGVILLLIGVVLSTLGNLA